MTEDEARTWLTDTFTVSRETLDKLAAYVRLVAREQQGQNLVSASTLPHFWARHIVDSAQLIRFAPEGDWLDIGSGAGLPGIVVAILTNSPIVLVEPRPLRAAFLTHVIEDLDIVHACVEQKTLASVKTRKFAIITARAVAPLPKLIAMARPFADLSTIWLLPKGRNGQAELASLPRAWHDSWHSEPSVTDPDSKILIGRGQMKG